MKMTNDNEIRLMEQRRDNFKEKYKLYPNYDELYDSDISKSYYFKGSLRDCSEMPGEILFDILEVKEILNYRALELVTKIFPDEKFYISGQNEFMIEGNDHFSIKIGGRENGEWINTKTGKRGLAFDLLTEELGLSLLDAVQCGGVFSEIDLEKVAERDDFGYLNDLKLAKYFSLAQKRLEQTKLEEIVIKKQNDRIEDDGKSTKLDNFKRYYSDVIEKKTIENIEMFVNVIFGNEVTDYGSEIRIGLEEKIGLHLRGPKAGQWINFETGKSGDIFDLFATELEMPKEEISNCFADCLGAFPTNKHTDDVFLDTMERLKNTRQQLVMRDFTMKTLNPLDHDKKTTSNEILSKIKQTEVNVGYWIKSKARDFGLKIKGHDPFKGYRFNEKPIFVCQDSELCEALKKLNVSDKIFESKALYDANLKKGRHIVVCDNIKNPEENVRMNLWRKEGFKVTVFQHKNPAVTLMSLYQTLGSEKVLNLLNSDLSPDHQIKTVILKDPMLRMIALGLDSSSGYILKKSKEPLYEIEGEMNPNLTRSDKKLLAPFKSDSEKYFKAAEAIIKMKAQSQTLIEKNKLKTIAPDLSMSM